MLDDEKCLCGSGRLYSMCCKPFSGQGIENYKKEIDSKNYIKAYYIAVAMLSDYLEDGMTPLRKLMYGYHRTGMDELSVNVTRARAVITSMLSGLKEAQQNKPMSALPGLFTEIKKDELINLYSRAAMKEKEEICELLSSINPSLTTEWEKIKQ